MEKDQIEKLREFQKYLDYLVGDLMMSRSYAYAQTLMSAIGCINDITSCYKPRG